MPAIEDGLYQPAMKARLNELEAEKAGPDDATRSGAHAAQNSPSTPNLAEVYRRKVEELESLLADEDHRDEAIESIRSMIETITLDAASRGPGLEALS